jgi:hypothetical protein
LQVGNLQQVYRPRGAQRFDPRDESLHQEGFCKVIVRPGLPSLDARRHGPSGEDPRGAMGLFDKSDHGSDRFGSGNLPSGAASRGPAKPYAA